MNCEIFRQRIEEDPVGVEATSAAHERECAACAAYARRVRAAERLIGEALRFDIAAMRERPRRGASRTAWAMAASAAAAAVAVWLGLTFVPSNDPAQLVATVQEHWYHEPESWVQTSTPVGATVLDEALAGQASVDLERLNVVSYARSCLVNGRWVPHLVVQGEAGPVMLLLLPHEQVPGALPLDLPDAGLRGAIMPLDRGSVAILGEDDEPLDPLQREIAAAVDWTI